MFDRISRSWSLAPPTRHDGGQYDAHPPTVVLSDDVRVLHRQLCRDDVLQFALISVALKRLDGESASVGDGLRRALANLPAILAYAIIAATVGAILRAIEERVGFVGRIVVAIIGAGWTLATAMTLPACS